MMIVATALTLGFSPRRAREKITSGIVVAPGPERNADSTTSSSESVNVSSQADSSACAIIGSVTSVEHLPRPRAEVHRGLFELRVERLQARLDDDGRVGHAEQQVAEPDRQHAALGKAEPTRLRALQRPASAAATGR